VAAACSVSSPPPTPSPSPTPEALRPLELTLKVGTPGASPDGSVITIEDTRQGALTFFDRNGVQMGSVGGLALGVQSAWLPDSSGLLVAKGPRNGFDLVVVESNGSLTKLPLRNALPSTVRASPNGRLIAAAAGDIVIVARDGTDYVIVPDTNGASLVGWDARGGLVYREGRLVHGLGANTFVAPLPDDVTDDPNALLAGMASPDGKVNVVLFKNDQARALFVIGDRITEGHAIFSGWVGSHEMLTRHNGEWFVDDPVAGTAERAPVPTSASILRAFKDTIVWTTTARDAVHVTNIRTGRERMVQDVPLTSLFIVPLGTNGLLAYSEGRAWVVDLGGLTA